MNENHLWGFLIAVVLGLLFLWLSLRLRKRQRLLGDLPTSKVSGVFIGLVELKGQAKSEAPLRSYLAEMDTVYYRWSIEEHWSRTVTETYTDKDGKTHTRTRHESGWTTVSEGGESAPFYLQDDTGALRVRPEGAKIEPLTVFSDECTPFSSLYFGKGPAGSIPHSDRRRRFREEALPLDTPLYIVGQAREREDIVAAEIAHSKDAPLFLISARSEESVRQGYAIGSWCLWVLGLAASVLGAFVLVQPEAHIFLFPWPPEYAATLGGVVFLFLWGLCWVWMVYNSVVGLKHRVDQAWSLIDVELKRRHDLIPRLEAVLKGWTGHERNVQEMVAKLRTQNIATVPGEAGPDLAGLAPGVAAVLEQYPELGAVAGFSALHAELVRTEERIALARGYFNEIATQLKTRCEQVPDLWVARLAKIKPKAVLVVEDFERSAVPLFDTKTAR